MNITIKAEPKPVKSGNFNYSNIKSSYGVNTLYFTKNGKPYTVIAGEVHFSRLPAKRWRETILKMRACGLNTISTYVFWNHHNPAKGFYDFSGDRDVHAFLSLCKDLHMPVILRIGPWCHGEVVRGGFPLFVDLMPGKRTDSKKYLEQVRIYWKRLFQEVKDFMDGETVIGIQLENEYTGPTKHIKTLRRIAEEIGFKTPFFTMTAWPSGKPDDDFLPMMGGYPDAPWARGKHALKPNNRFAITPGKTEDEIGADLHKNNVADQSVYDYVPYASCETGPGVQADQHRRPFISEKDGYGVGFAKFASGVNWLGYYMFCGGRNPSDRLLQESRITGYPNDLPVIDYDFQAPLSRYGICRDHGDRLRLMHLFITDFDREICTKQAYFPKWKSIDPCDISFLKCSVRADENASGYFFSGTYEKGLRYKDFHDVRVTFEIGGKTVHLPPVDIKAGSMFFYPFNIRIGDVDFDYILAQPVVKYEENGKIVCWFAQCEGMDPVFSVNGKKYPLDFSENGTEFGNVKLIVLSYEDAKKFWFIHHKPILSDGTVYADGETVFCEKITDTDLKNEFSLTKCDKVSLPHNFYLYSTGRRSYYRLKIPKDILKEHFDIMLEFYFTGLNLQVFSGKTLINDYFNIDRKFVMCLRDYQQYLENGSDLIIRTAPKTKHGISNAYNEIIIPLHSDKLELKKASVIKKEQVF